MRVWRRRLVAAVAAGVGGVGLVMSTAGAQTTPPTTVPTFTIPDFPEFPDFTIPDFTIPTTIPTPPTMPVTTTTTSPPPTMPPSTTTTTGPPPTMPVTTITIPAETEELIEDVIRRLEEFGDIGAEIIEDLRELLELF